MFISKGHWSWGISGGYLRTYNVSPSFSYFLAGGLCVRLRDNSAITFSISRDLDYLAFQVGYVHYIAPKKR